MRFDNGPEFIAQPSRDWCRFNGAGPVHRPRLTLAERLDRVVQRPAARRVELLNGWTFDSLLEARVIIEDWRTDYNTHRPHTAHGDLTPTEFARAWTTNHQPQPA